MSASKRAEEKEQSMSDSVALHAEMWRFQHTGSSCTVFVMAAARPGQQCGGPRQVGVRHKSLRLAGPEAWGKGSNCQAGSDPALNLETEKDMAMPLSCSWAVLSPRVLHQKTPALEDWPGPPRLGLHVHTQPGWGQMSWAPCLQGGCEQKQRAAVSQSGLTCTSSLGVSCTIQTGFGRTAWTPLAPLWRETTAAGGGVHLPPW